jgi:4'-phosphopantetheinyl transferase
MNLSKVRIQFQNEVQWQHETECDYKLDDTLVDVWRINITSNLEFIDNCLNVLSPDEITRANRYVQKKDRQRFIISRGALRFLLNKYAGQSARNIKFKIGANKKPFIDQSTLKYNVSHSDNWVLITISNTEVGADTEIINQLFNYKEVLTDNFSHREINFIEQDQSSNNFFLLWTRKEALTKATGQGLDENLKYIPCLNGDHEIDDSMLSSSKNWLVNSFFLDNKNMATVVTETQASNSRFWNFDLKSFTYF